MLSFKNVLKLKHKKYRHQFEAFIIEGTKAVEDSLTSNLELDQVFYTQDWFRQNQVTAHHQVFRSLSHQQLSRDQLNALADSTTPQGVIAVARLPKTDLSQLSQASLLAILEDIRDPGNLGTMIRTADWFGVDAIMTIGGADPYQPKVVRSSMGSVGRVPLVESHSILEDIHWLKQHQFTVVTTRPELAKQAAPIKKLPKAAVIFGNEATGTSSRLDQLADTAISIPQYGAAESLNVAVSFGIVMYELTKK